MRTSTAARRHDRGFTLVELLIVIVILGVLATITVFAVRGITNQGQTSACASDKKSVETAEEANMAQTGSYATEDVLVTNGLLREQSPNIDVTVGTDTAGKPAYTLSNVGTCAGGSAVTTTPPSSSTPPASSAPPAATLFPSFTRTIIGTGTPVIAFIGYGAGNTIVQNWKTVTLQANASGPTTARYAFIDTSPFTNIGTSRLLELVQDADKVIWVDGGDPGSLTVIGGVMSGDVAPTYVSTELGGVNTALVPDANTIGLTLLTWGLYY